MVPRRERNAGLGYYLFGRCWEVEGAAIGSAREERFSCVGCRYFDQLSRPYFPSDIKGELTLSAESAAEDVIALQKQVGFVFKEVATRTGLQVILLEHAYFSDSPAYIRATEERWTKATGGKLIPDDWPSASDGLADSRR